MRFYIAAPYAARNPLRNYEFHLEAYGHESRTTWLDATHEIKAGTLGTAPAMDDEYAMEHATQDIEDVSASDVVILVTWDTARGLVPPETEMGPSSGGRHVETGIALAQGIPVFLWGQPENIFHRGPGVTVCRTWEEVLNNVEELQKARMGRLA